MKKILLSLFVVSLLGFNPVYSQFSFGVSPGFSLNSAYFGYKINKVVPSVGFQYYSTKMNYEESGREYNSTYNLLMDYNNKSSFSVNLYVPSVGVKYFIAQRNKVQAYLSLNVSKPILNGKMKGDDTYNAEFNNNIKKVKLWGGELGVGMEYFFDENFSLGGEFGLMYLHLRYKDSDTHFEYNPSTGQSELVEINTDYKLAVKPTYSRISLNYYF